MTNKYCQIPIKIIKLYGRTFPFAIFLKVADKAIKLSNKDEKIVSIIEKYEERGVTEIFVIKDDFEKFIQELKTKTALKLFDPETIIPEKVDLINDTYRVAAESFKKLGVKKETLILAKAVNESAMTTLEKSPNIFHFFEEFKDRCSKELMQIMLTNYVMCGMIDTFDWASENLKEKLTMGSLLCDVLLDESDFEEIRNCNKEYSTLSIKSKNHPSDTVKLLAKESELISRESLEVIKYHHETPRGDGFPNEVPGKNVSLFPAIRIVADKFVEILIEEKFNYQKKKDILVELEEEFCIANFRKAFYSLRQMLGTF